MAAPRLSVLTSAYRSQPYLASFLEDLQRQTLFEQLELVLVLNQPSSEELKTAHAFADRIGDRVQIHEVDPVETLGASWNRAWRAARAPLLAPWNVDDRRQPDSLERQATALDAQADWSLCYGDFLIVPAYGVEEGRRRHTPPFNAGYFQRAFPQDGAYWVYRAQLAEALGYFDEQFKVGPDFELSVRMAAGGLRMGRVDGLLGYFTDAQQGLSTRAGAQPSAVDRTAIQLRYGIFDKVEPQLRPAAEAYDLERVLAFGEWRPLAEYLPGHRRRLALRWPLWLLGYLRRALRSLLERLGLLRPLYRFLERTLKRDL